MDNFIDECIAYSRKFTKKRMTADGVVCAGPCFLFDIHLAATSGGATANVLYHGQLATAEAMINLNTLTSTSFNYWWQPPLWCPDGLYLDVGSNLAGLSFHYLEV